MLGLSFKGLREARGRSGFQGVPYVCLFFSKASGKLGIGTESKGVLPLPGFSKAWGNQGDVGSPRVPHLCLAFQSPQGD